MFKFYVNEYIFYATCGFQSMFYKLKWVENQNFDNHILHCSNFRWATESNWVYINTQNPIDPVKFVDALEYNQFHVAWQSYLIWIHSGIYEGYVACRYEGLRVTQIDGAFQGDKTKASTIAHKNDGQTYNLLHQIDQHNQGSHHTERLCLHKAHPSNAAGHPCML